MGQVQNTTKKEGRLVKEISRVGELGQLKERRGKERRGQENSGGEP